MLWVERHGKQDFYDEKNIIWYLKYTVEITFIYVFIDLYIYKYYI